MPQLAFCALLYLLDVTRSVQPDHVLSKDSPRSYARWTREERQLVGTLLAAGIEMDLVASLVERTPEALRLQSAERAWPPVGDLPQSMVPITAADVQLLVSWKDQPPRDPLAWQYGQPLDPALLAPAAQPTLRVLLVRPDPALALPSAGLVSDPWVSQRQDLDSAAQGTWLDLATQLTQSGQGQVLYAGPDAHRARLLAIRAAIARQGGRPARRGSVRLDPGPGLRDRLPDAVLIDRPERWQVAQLASLRGGTLILVLPALPGPKELAIGDEPLRPFHGDARPLPLPLRAPAPSWRDQAALDHQRQQHLIRAVAGRRTVEHVTLTGIPNSSGTAARLDWLALRWLPPSGTVTAPRGDLLLRAATWYQLSTGQRGVLSEALPPHLQWTAPFMALQLAAPRAVEHLHQQFAAQQVDLLKRVQARVVLDSLYPPVLPTSSGLKFELAADVAVTYIGR